MRRAGIVLCGGRSRRMGRPKALLPWFGPTLVEHVVSQLAPCVDEVLVVTARDLPIERLVAKLGARLVLDREAGRGPLAALRDGLAAARAEHAFVTATDAPFLTAAAVEALFEQAEAGARAGHEGAVVPRAEGFLQVLSAVYPGGAWREADALLEAERAGSRTQRGATGDAAREASPLRLLERIGFEAVEAFSEASLPAWTSFNTPDEYLALARRHDPAARASVEWGAQRACAVPIGRLDVVLRAAAPPGFPLHDPDALAGLVIAFGEGEGEGESERSLRLEGVRPEDLALPVGPGERVRISSR